MSCPDPFANATGSAEPLTGSAGGQKPWPIRLLVLRAPKPRARHRRLPVHSHRRAQRAIPQRADDSRPLSARGDAPDSPMKRKPKVERRTSKDWQRASRSRLRPPRHFQCHRGPLQGTSARAAIQGHSASRSSIGRIDPSRLQPRRSPLNSAPHAWARADSSPTSRARFGPNVSVQLRKGQLAQMQSEP